MRPRLLVAMPFLLALLAAVPALASEEAILRALPAGMPADSLPRVLAAFEARPPAGAESGDAAYMLGAWHLARGEYRQAADALRRAGDRLHGTERAKARELLGRAWLGAGDANAARTAFAQALGDAAPERRGLVLAGEGMALEGLRRPNEAAEVYRGALDRSPGEAGAPMLERLAALADAQHRADEAMRARARLQQEFPNSLEAARLAGQRAAPARDDAAPARGPVTLQIGVFADRARALALAESAKRAGFADAEVRERTAADGTSKLYAVRLGRYTDAAQARAMGEKLERALGVGWQVVTP